MKNSKLVRACLRGAAAVLLAAAPASRLNATEVRITEAQAKEAAVSKVLPEYPAMARQLKVTGKVELELAIGESGVVEDVKIVSGSPVLTRPCAKAMQAWKFRPFKQDGKSVRVLAPMTFEFR